MYSVMLKRIQHQQYVRSSFPHCAPFSFASVYFIIIFFCGTLSVCRIRTKLPVIDFTRICVLASHTYTLLLMKQPSLLKHRHIIKFNQGSYTSILVCFVFVDLTSRDCRSGAACRCCNMATQEPHIHASQLRYRYLKYTVMRNVVLYEGLSVNDSHT